MDKVFVYGSLKKGFFNHRIIEECNFIKARAPLMTMHAGPAFPFAKRGNGVIKGELYDVDAKTLKRLDRLEGHPNFYKRERVAVYDEKSNKHEAWIYLFDRADNYPLVEDGNWR